MFMFDLSGYHIIEKHYLATFLSGLNYKAKYPGLHLLSEPDVGCSLEIYTYLRRCWQKNTFANLNFFMFGKKTFEIKIY